MPKQTTNIQCPSCGGPLHFDPALGKLKCDYCGSLFTTEEIEALYGKKEEAAAAVGAQTQWANDTNQFTAEEAKHMRAYSCPSCGAQLICDENTAATSCPYCGNPTVVPAQFSGALKPDYVIPFKLDKDQAVAALKQYYQGKPLLPKAFANHNHIEEIKGIYVPFWLYDADMDADLEYHGTRVSTFVAGDEEVTETDHYQVIRQGSVEFRRVPVDGSSKMPDTHMDAIEPYQYDQLVPFESAYLPGYLADRYDVDAKASKPRAQERMQASAISAIQATIGGYTSLMPIRQQTASHNDSVKYAFLPVWLLSTKWNGKNFLFAMNGQTGKLIGDLPVDPGRFALWFFGITGSLMAVLWLLLLR